jgi:L-alanine-DL-glutamate epimerase-like enolase superfamily enzyme
MATVQRTDVAVERVDVAAFRVPTATAEESDGTLTWDSTTLVAVELHGGGATGLGYTYCHPAAAQVVETKLAKIVEGADALMPQATWAQMQVATRQMGHAGIAAMAISAVDVALWDLKARLLGVCLADALPRYRESVPAYGSGGFTSYDDGQLADQLAGWAAAGFGSVKIKVGRHPTDDPHRLDVARAAIGDDVELMVDANGAHAPKQALRWAQRFASEHGVTYFEEPVSSEDLAGLALVRARGPAGMAVAAGEYGWDLPYFHAMLDAGAVDILQADVSRCGGITNLLRIDGLCKARNLAFSAHCVPAVTAHAGCALETLVHAEYFFDHQRIERMLFDGVPEPDRGQLTPDRSRPGLGLELRRADARRHQVYGDGG